MYLNTHNENTAVTDLNKYIHEDSRRTHVKHVGTKNKSSHQRKASRPPETSTSPQYLAEISQTGRQVKAPYTVLLSYNGSVWAIISTTAAQTQVKHRS